MSIFFCDPLLNGLRSIEIVETSTQANSLLLGPSLTDSYCHRDIGPGIICPGNICPYQEYLTSY